MLRRWVFTRWFALVIGLVTGALAGLCVYGGGRLTGPWLYTFCGTVAGGVAALAFYAYRRTIRLTELTVSIPNVTNLKFAVTPSNEGVAWRLFVESATRVSSQPLEDGSGVIHEALDSLYRLFQDIRRILLEARPTGHPPGTQTVEHLAMTMLNQQMRPFISKWHAQLSSWEAANPGRSEAEWPLNQQCRNELNAMRAGMLVYVRGLGQLAGATDVDIMLGTTSIKAPPLTSGPPLSERPGRV
jgi:hypothetical protein